MTAEFDRRRVMQLSLLAAGPGLTPLGGADGALAQGRPDADAGSASIHDFDFFLGSWTVRHRRLKTRLAGSNDWEEFDGTTTCRSLLGGVANINESVAHRPSGTAYGLGIRAFDAGTNSWADWWLDARNPVEIGAPGIGRFANGVGTFLSDEMFEGRPVKVRGRFSSISPTLAQWEQAFSPDGGATWETNWVMRYMRTG